ncbi:uncharacterized protein si:dkeyp-97a10.3 [Centropristis striata]|uniref:uncharacterized protein si:dkeyp-97a10.3 n=1 Tax=Centropristis striata TaxID=184440 RepID=UPI0027E07694|nr:uncharacterized protein si:dkeyp-97a10.3 [Centropristis striata]
MSLNIRVLEHDSQLHHLVTHAVNGVSLFLPTVAVEGRNVSLRCTWTAGTEITVAWGKNDVAVTADSRITISGGSLVINPARRGDAGTYTCTVSNLVSAQTATQSLTVYYGPDTPVLTKDTPKECVGGGDVLVGQKVRLTCMSDSLPPALFSWQRDGQAVASGQPDSGVLSLQTFSTDESGRYVCTARNSITGVTSEQATDLAIVDTCLTVGEVVGIVIGGLLLILIIILLIVLIVCLARRRRRRGQPRENDTTVLVQKSDPVPRPVPQDPQPNGARDLGQGPHPPLYHTHTHTRPPDRLYTAPQQGRGNPQTLPPDGLHSSDTHRHNGRTNRLPHNTAQNGNSYPHNGIDNTAFTHTDTPNVNTQPQNPNILIQAGSGQGGAQPSAVHVNLNTLPQNAQQNNNNNAPMPTIHVNLNSYPTNGQQTQQDSSFPLTNTTNNNNTQSQQNLTHAGELNPRIQNEQPYHSEPRVIGHEHPRELIPTGYTHYNSNNNSLRNANTQTYQQEPEPHGRSDRNSWDLLRGTPAYPSGTFQRRQPPPEYSSDSTYYTTDYSTDYTSHPPIREVRTPSRSQPRPQSRAASRDRAPSRRDAESADRRTRSRSADLRAPNTRGVSQLEAERHTQISGHTQRMSAQRDIRVSPGSQIAPRQEATHSNNPRALPLRSQPASVGRSAASQGPATQQGPTALRGADSRALADPNHLPQAHMAQQHRAAPIQTPPQGLGKETQPVINGASQPRQRGTAPNSGFSAQRNPSNLTQAALTAHTKSAETFQNRKQQTQAALLHPGPQTLPDPPREAAQISTSRSSAPKTSC